MIVKLLIVVLMFQLALAQVLERPLECKNPRSKICQLQTVSSIGFEVPKFPNLTEKHTLIIKSGDVPFFNANFTSQFGGVTKVMLGRLNIKSLHIPANWISLNAESNQIGELMVDDDDDDDDEDKELYLSDGPIESNESAKSEPRAEDPVGSVEGNKELATTGNKTDSDLEIMNGAQTAFEKVVKNDNTTDSEPTKSNKVQTGFDDGAKDDIATGSKSEFKSETPTVLQEGVKNNNTADSKLQGNETGTKELDPTRVEPEPEQRPDPTEEEEDTDEYSTKEPPKLSEGAATNESAELAQSASVYKLRSLNLANNQLQSIRKLKCMVNLEEIRLDGNELEFIEMATFDGMKKLKKLSLSNNKINRISCPEPMTLPALEWFSLAFNRLAKLQIINWDMQQLVQLDVSHNMLVKLDVNNFDQFVSLEKLSVSNNSWICYWLNEALKEIIARDFITLVDRNDDPGHCPSGLPVEGICCSFTTQDDTELNNESLDEKIQRFQRDQEDMGNDFKGKLGSFGKEWRENWEKVSQNVTAMEKRIGAKNKELKDDNKVTEKEIKELEQMIAKCQSLLAEMELLRNRTALIARSYTQSFYMTIDLKNKLLVAMKSSEKLKSELHQYETSFKTYET